MFISYFQLFTTFRRPLSLIYFYTFCVKCHFFFPLKFLFDSRLSLSHRVSGCKVPLVESDSFYLTCFPENLLSKHFFRVCLIPLGG